MAPEIFCFEYSQWRQHIALLARITVLLTSKLFSMLFSLQNALNVFFLLIHRSCHCTVTAMPASEEVLNPTSDFWIATENVEYIGNIVSSFSGHCFIDMLDLFAGKGNAGALFQRSGKCAVAYDILLDASHDILTKSGFTIALRLVLSLKSGALLLCGIPCSLFVYMSSSVHKRSSKGPQGDESIDVVRAANAIASNAVELCRIASCRHVLCIVEQPLNSVMFSLQCFEQIVYSDSWFSIVTYMGCFGHALSKPTRLWCCALGNVGVQRQFVALLSRSKRDLPLHLQCIAVSRSVKKAQLITSASDPFFQVCRPMASAFYERTSDGKVNGKKSSHISGQYTEAFSRALLDLHAFYQSFCTEPQTFAFCISNFGEKSANKRRRTASNIAVRKNDCIQSGQG